jgi:hypothetical protein
MIVRFDGARDWEFMRKIATEKEGWAEARKIIDKRMLRKLETL